MSRTPAAQHLTAEGLEGATSVVKTVYLVVSDFSVFVLLKDDLLQMMNP